MSVADRQLVNRYPWWKVRIWYGATTWAWLRLLWMHGGRFSIALTHRIVLVGIISLINSVTAIVQRIVFGPRIARQQLPPVVFIIGHWRTGTTYLQELLARDRRFVSPSVFQCQCPEHFLISKPLAGLFSVFTPAKRPMDDMDIRLDHPYEDEFALLLSGSGSPYQLFGYPLDRAVWQSWFRITGACQKPWLNSLKSFLRSVLLERSRFQEPQPRFLLLKSPPHTARLALLAENFKDARFIHLVRQPEMLFSSSCNMFGALIKTQALNLPGGDLEQIVEDIVFDNFETLYEHFDGDCRLIGADRIMTLKYEDIAQSPENQLERIYDFIGMDLDSTVRDVFRQEIEARQDYRVSAHELAPETAAKIRERWNDYGREYGYLQCTNEELSSDPRKIRSASRL